MLCPWSWYHANSARLCLYDQSAAGLASILSGWFTGNVLFVEQEGYRTAYYIASGIYVVACMLLMAGLWKYNRAAPNKEEGRS